MTERSLRESIRIERPVREVFRAWTSAAELGRWFAPMAVRPAEIEARFENGGPYRVRMDLGDAGIHVIEGEFLQIIPEEKIRMTWRCDAWADPPSIVDVTFEPVDDATLVRVHHSGIWSAEAEDGQRFGWTACLNALRQTLTTPQQEMDHG